MLNITESKRILNAGDRKYTDEEIKLIREYIYFVAKIQVEIENGNLNNIENETV